MKKILYINLFVIVLMCSCEHKEAIINRNETFNYQRKAKMTDRDQQNIKGNAKLVELISSNGEILCQDYYDREGNFLKIVRYDDKSPVATAIQIYRRSGDTIIMEQEDYPPFYEIKNEEGRIVKTIYDTVETNYIYEWAGDTLIEKTDEDDWQLDVKEIYRNGKLAKRIQLPSIQYYNSNGDIEKSLIEGTSYVDFNKYPVLDHHNNWILWEYYEVRNGDTVLVEVKKRRIEYYE